MTQVFHVVPDAAWPDVERVLRGYPLIMYADGVFRMVMSEREERRGRNPQTGEPLMLAPPKVVKFKCPVVLKDKLNSKNSK